MKINKISIITIVFNDVKHIARTLESVAEQKKNFKIEYIVIDGNSKDGTKDLLNEKKDIIDILISERDNGIYDAINKGIRHATGDVIALLHSGDVYFNSFTLNDVSKIFNSKDCDIIYSDCIIFNYNKNKIFRYYFSKIFSKKLMLFGWMPPHPGCFISKKVFKKKIYSTDYKIASDFELLFYLSLDKSVRWARYDKISVVLDDRGISSQLKNKLLINSELKNILKSHNKNFFSRLIFLRYFIRIFEMIYKPRTFFQQNL